jgi:hypothetical protein
MNSLCSLVQRPANPSLLDPNILLSTLFSNTFDLSSPRSVRDQVSHPCKTTCKIIIWCIEIFKCLERRRDGKIQYMNIGSSVGIALGYGLDDRSSRFRFPAEAGNFSLHHRVQNGSEVHRASYPVGTRGSFPGSKVAGA